MLDRRKPKAVPFLLLLIAAAVPTSSGRADPAPAPPIVTSLSEVVPLGMTLPGGTQAATEIAPALLPGPNGLHLVYLATAFTYLCGTTGNPFQAPVVLSAADCAVVDVPETQTSPKHYIAPEKVPTSGHQWKLEYDAVFSAQITHDSVANRDLIITVNHNEVKNEVVPGWYNYHSPFAPTADALPPSCGYAGNTGRGPRGYQTCWLAYGAFVSLEQNELTAATNFGRSPDISEIGPVLWPTSGYFDLSRGSAGKLSSGLRHPSSIISNGYLYIYYLDTSKGRIGGLSILGTKVARAPISPRGVPGAFLAWDGRAFAAPELPPGFDRNNIAAFIARPGPQVASLFAAEARGNTAYSLQSSHFSVAYDARRRVFIGVEEYVEGDEAGRPVHQMALRLSTDLVHWSARTPLSINGRDMAYPEFADAAFTSNNAVDLGNLFLLGTRGGRVTYAHLTIR
jgi:hypothetical protein